MRFENEKAAGRKVGRLGRLLMTLAGSMAAFMILAGPSCPFIGSKEKAPAAKPEATAPAGETKEAAAAPATKPAPSGKQQQLEVGRLTLTDGAGNERARLEVLPDGKVGISFLDGRGKERAFYGVEADGAPIYVMRDDFGTERARMFLSNDGSPMLDLKGRRGDVRSYLTLNEGEDPMLALLGENGSAIIKLFLRKNGEPVLSYLDADGKEIAIIPLKPTKVATEPKPKAPPATTVIVNPPPATPPPPPPPPPPKVEEKPTYGETMVVIVKGNKPVYHLPTCPLLNAVPKGEKRYLLIKDLPKGYGPCPMCRPPRANP